MIQPGKVWLDTAGKPIQSHFGGVLYDEGVYYWYGANWDSPAIPPQTLPNQSMTWFLNRGVTIYSSRDLTKWKHESTVLNDVTFDPRNLLQPLNGIVRPKILRNPRTGKYVLLAALICPDFETYNDVIVAVADKPVGPYELKGLLQWQGRPNRSGLWTPTWERAAKHPQTRILGFDTGAFQDDDGKGYLMVGRVDTWLYELSDDYLSVTKVHFMEGAHGEAPTLFKSRGMYYFVSSQVTGWAANANTYCTAPSILGPWQPRGAFAEGPRAKTTFDCQVNFVLPVAGKPDAFIFIGDDFHAASDSTIPDLHAATHVWLPLEIDHGTHTVRMPWREQWDVSVFDGR